MECDNPDATADTEHAAGTILDPATQDGAGAQRNRTCMRHGHSSKEKSRFVFTMLRTVPESAVGLAQLIAPDIAYSACRNCSSTND
jgi:hypothetical protein